MVLRLPFAVAALALTGVLAGCPTAVPIAGSAPSSAPAARGVLTGTLRVPASIISYNGGGFISTNGGGIVAQGGGNFISTNGAGLRLLALAQQPVAGAHVYLANAAGAKLQGLPEATTDAAGHFALADVPGGYTFLVVAEAGTKNGPAATFQTLVHATGSSAPADITAATSLAAAAALADHPGVDLGALDDSAFLAARDGLDQALADGQLPDFTKKAEVQAKAGQLAADAPAVQQAVNTLKTGLAGAATSFTSLPSTPPAAPTAAPSAVPSCAARLEEHYFRPVLDGVPVPVGWRLDVGPTEYGVTDPGGVARAWTPVGCPLTFVLHDPAGPTYTTTMQVESGGQDTNAKPIPLPLHK